MAPPDMADPLTQPWLRLREILESARKGGLLEKKHWEKTKKELEQLATVLEDDEQWESAALVHLHLAQQAPPSTIQNPAPPPYRRLMTTRDLLSRAYQHECSLHKPVDTEVLDKLDEVTKMAARAADEMGCPEIARWTRAESQETADDELWLMEDQELALADKKDWRGLLNMLDRHWMTCMKRRNAEDAEDQSPLVARRLRHIEAATLLLLLIVRSQNRMPAGRHRILWMAYTTVVEGSLIASVAHGHNQPSTSVDQSPSPLPIVDRPPSWSIPEDTAFPEEQFFEFKRLIHWMRKGRMDMAKEQLQARCSAFIGDVAVRVAWSIINLSFVNAYDM